MTTCTASAGQVTPREVEPGDADGRIPGSNFLDERDPIRAVGPITVLTGGASR